ncbi:hypothetical protein YM18_3100 [Geobacter sulfurreducens]|nr:hypothetical protein YM18_3100 [Geobacter sulfurreducens]
MGNRLNDLFKLIGVMKVTLGVFGRGSRRPSSRTAETIGDNVEISVPP